MNTLIRKSAQSILDNFRRAALAMLVSFLPMAAANATDINNGMSDAWVSDDAEF